MPHTRTPFSTTSLLRRIFLDGLPDIPHHAGPRARLRPAHGLPRLPSHQTIRHASISSSTSGAKPGKKDILQRPARNEEIRSPMIRLVDAEGNLSPAPVSTAATLRGINTKTQTLGVVAASTDGSPPLCRIYDRAAVYAAEKAKRKSRAAAAGALAEKKMELNWGIDANDLAHRLRKLRDFLARGHRVEILCAPKRRAKREPTLDEAGALVKQIRDLVAELGRETKDVKGKLLGRMTITGEGRKPV